MRCPLPPTKLDTRRGCGLRTVERLARDDRVLWLFFAGHSYRAIAREVGLRSPQSVGNVVRRELARSQDCRVGTEVGRALWIERSEQLFAESWPAALAGDHRAAESCLRLMESQARFYGLL